MAGHNPDLLLLDEPTRGIDVGAKADIQETVAELAEGGMGVVFISSELEEVVRLSERIVILKDHQKVGEVVNGPEVTAESIVSVIATESGRGGGGSGRRPRRRGRRRRIAAT